MTAAFRPKPPLPAPQVALVDLGPRGATHVYRNEPFEVNSSVCDDQSAIIMLHGLGACHSGSYMTGVCEALLQRGFRTIRLDMPGAGPSSATTDLPPHAGSSVHVLKMLDWISENWGINKFKLVGFSLGGNISLHLAAAFASQLEKRSKDGKFSIESIYAMAPPIDLDYCCRSMERGLNRIYAKYFLRNLSRSAKARAERWPRWKDVSSGFTAKTIRSFDDAVTAPLSGFADASEYYAFSSVHQRLDEIKIPTTIVADRDDPIVPMQIFERAKLGAIRMITTEFGGHLGYYTHRFGKGVQRWANDAFADLVLEGV